jgi:ubiquinone/menaquinone biosynthesis C-methylase UbiE
MNYDKIDPDYYEKMYDLVPREIYMKEHWRPLIEKELEKYCKGKNALDLGYGTGIYTTTINKYACKVYGIDITKNWVNYIKNRKGIPNIILADAHKIPFKNETVDIIVTTGLFEYVNREIVIKEMKRILTLDGFCIIFVPNKYSLTRVIGKLIHIIIGKKYNPNEPSKKDMMKLFYNNGFELIDYKMNDGLIWLPNLLDKLIGKKIYFLIEKFTGIFGENPYSTAMLFIIKKKG